MTRPEPIEWPSELRGVPHGTPLLVHGKLQAALKQGDGSPFAPRPRSHLWQLHVAVAFENDVGPACGYPTYLDELTIGAAEAKARCRRPGCRELFARADDVAAELAAPNGQPAPAMPPAAAVPTRGA